MEAGEQVRGEWGRGEVTRTGGTGGLWQVGMGWPAAGSELTGTEEKVRGRLPKGTRMAIGKCRRK